MSIAAWVGVALAGIVVLVILYIIAAAIAIAGASMGEK